MIYVQQIGSKRGEIGLDPTSLCSKVPENAMSGKLQESQALFK